MFEDDQEFDKAWDDMFGTDSSQEGQNTETNEEPIETKEAADTTDGNTEVDTGGKEEEPEAKDVPGDIPYKRFAQIAKDRREANAKVKDLEAQIAALKSNSANAQTPTPDDDVDELLRSILEDDGDNTSTEGNAELQSRIAQLEAKQAETQFESNLAATLAKHPGVDRKWLIDETLRTQGKYSLEELATARSEDSEISNASALAKFFEANPDLAAAYKAKQGKVDGGSDTKLKDSPEAAPSLRNTATGKAPPNLDPKEGETSGDFLSRVWDSMQ